MNKLNLAASILITLLGRVPGDQAVETLYNLLLGRSADEGGRQYYSKLFSGSDEAKLSVIMEIASSEEASRYSLWKMTKNDDYDGYDSLDDQTALKLIACVGVLFRNLIVERERLEKFEELARLTLLSVPEIAGSAFDRLESRVKNLEELLQLRHRR